MTSLTALGNEQLDPLFLATVQAVEESIINAMIAAEPMTGYEGRKAAAIDHTGADQVAEGRPGRRRPPRR